MEVEDEPEIEKTLLEKLLSINEESISRMKAEFKRLEGDKEKTFDSIAHERL